MGLFDCQTGGAVGSRWWVALLELVIE